MDSRPASRARLPRIVKSLGTVSLLNDFASEMMYPLLPALVAGLGGGAIALGTLDGTAEAVSSIVKLFAGRLADRRGWRRPLIVGGYALAAIARPVIGVAAAAWQVVTLRAVDRLGKGARTPPRDAVIADATDLTIRGRAFGFHRMMDHSGAMIGPLVAFALLKGFDFTPSAVILWTALPGAAAVAVVAWALAGQARDTKPAVAEGRTPPDTPHASGGRAPSTSLIVLIVGFALVRFPETLMLLRLQHVGVAVAFVPIVWALLHAVRTAASYPGGWLTDRIGSAGTMLIGWAIYAVVAAGLATAGGEWAAVGWFLAFGVVAGATESPERALVAAWGKRRERGAKFGVYHASVGLAALPGGIALGVLYEKVSATAAFGVSAAVAALLLLVGLAIPRYAASSVK